MIANGDCVKVGKEHKWIFLASIPNVMQCGRCLQMRDLAPQHHLYLLLRDPDGWRRKIDTIIVPQVQAAWVRGVRLTGSCQGGCFTTHGPSSAVLEFRRADLHVMEELFSELDGVTFEHSGICSFMLFSAPEKCPMWEAEAELGEQANTRPYSV